MGTHRKLRSEISACGPRVRGCSSTPVVLFQNCIFVGPLSQDLVPARVLRVGH